MIIAIELAGGLALLALGGEWIVRGAVGFARRLGLSELLIGIVVVGFGTSTPELVTSLDAALRNSPGVAVGNVVGSNISNILLIFALCALARPIPVERGRLKRDSLVMAAVSLGFVVFALANPHVGRLSGAIMVGSLAAYLVFAYVQDRGMYAYQPEAGPEQRAAARRRLWAAIGYSAAGLAALIVGADFLVRGAVSLARSAGLSETVIGLTIVAVGTSLPELAASLFAALRGRVEVAFGNILGSNIYNVLSVLGATALVRPLAIPDDLSLADMGVFMGAAATLTYFAWARERVTRLAGAVMLAAYCGYIAYLLRDAMA